MKKVGIVSLYIGQNFGNKLQNYAVEQICKDYGFAPYTFKYEAVNTKPIKKAGKASKLKPSYIMAFAKSFLSGRCNIKNTDTSIPKQFIYWYKNKNSLSSTFKKRENKYNIFDFKNLNFAQRAIRAGEENSPWTKEFSMFLAGSDQVWNPYYLFVGSNNFLQFAPQEKRATIAPSFGVSEIPEERKADFSKWLNEIAYLSVREDAGQKIIEDLTGRGSVVIADPTIIAPTKIWDELATKPDFELPKKYLLTYFLGDRTKKYSNYVNKIAKKYDLEIVNLLDILSPQYLTCDPAEFVYCIQNAEFVCTDSFHATVFSILYKKPFVTFDRVEGKRSMGSRITTLLTNFDMLERKFENIKANKNPIETDFSKSDATLDDLRTVAAEYLDIVFASAENTDVAVDDTFNVYNKDDCTGCNACVNACPVNALGVEIKDGFSYPALNEDKCIHCNKCARVCPVNNAKELPTPEKAFAMRIKEDEDVLKNSSSGGVVSALANSIFANGGVVVGASFNDSFEVEHIVVDSANDLQKIRKAKYVQSSVLNVYEPIKSALDEDKRVMFTGTPCQVAAIKSSFNSENLITVAIVCHGVPSPVKWSEHLKATEQEHNAKLVAVDFRDKSSGWKNYQMKYEFDNGEIISINPSTDKYMSDFYHNKSLRPSCGNCHFKAGNSEADITIGDFWGFNILSPELDDNTGVSVVTIHTDKGQKFIEESKIDVVKEYDCFTAMGQNPSYFYSTIIKK